MEQTLDRTLAALADPTRRQIITRLSRGAARVTEIAQPFSISLNSVSKHIQTLERAGLVVREKRGREHVLTLNPNPILHVEEWLQSQRAAWKQRLSALDAMLQEEDHKK